MNDTLIYSLSNVNGIKDILTVACEIQTETGLCPDEIRLKDGRRLKYNKRDAILLKVNTITEVEYIMQNLIMD